MWESSGRGLLHFFITKRHLCLGAACLLYQGGGGGGKGLCPPAWGAAADPLMPRARSWARWRGASVLLLGPVPSHMPSVLASPAALPSCKTEHRKGQADPKVLCCRSTFISVAKEMVPWV